MLKRIVGAMLLTLLLVPMASFAAPKRAFETIDLQVVSSKTARHGSPPNVFSYTEVVFARVNGKNVTFVCEQRGDECPAMENGKTYAAEKSGNLIYITMTSPDIKKPFAVRFRDTGSW
jgi:hypothetical protein